MGSIRIANSLVRLAREIVGGYPEELSWADNEKGAPKTPWGVADVAYKIAKGLTWYGTPSHGGLSVSRGLASKKLSSQAVALGLNWRGSIWYEEDIAWVIPFYENPQWEKTLHRVSGGSIWSESKKLKAIEDYFPAYFESEFVEESQNVPPKLKEIQLDDMVVLTTRPSDFVITEIRGSKVIGMSGARRYTMPRNTFQDKVIEVIRDGRTIWKK